MSADPDILLLAGPTAAGKTRVSVEAARQLDAEIVNADSMQVYRRLRILTARPDIEEQAGIPHHLFGCVEPADRFSVGRWAQQACAAISDITGRGKRVVVVGGTGLYFKALTEGLAPTPQIPEAVRQSVETLLAERGVDALHAEAMQHDPEGAARLKPGDTQRLQRVVEVGRATGQPLSQLQASTRPLLARDRWRGLIIEPARADLYPQIEARFDQMLEDGALREAGMIAALGLDPDLPAMKAVGLPPLLAHLRGEIDLTEAIRIAKRDSRRYAKRQFTWFRNQCGDWPRLDISSPARALEAWIAGGGMAGDGSRRTADPASPA